MSATGHHTDNFIAATMETRCRGAHRSHLAGSHKADWPARVSVLSLLRPPDSVRTCMCRVSGPDNRRSAL